MGYQLTTDGIALLIRDLRESEMTGLKCDRCGQEIKSGESWERDVHDKPFSPYESEYAFNKYGGNARHVGECPIKYITCPCLTWASMDEEYLKAEVGTRHHPYCDGKGQNKYGYATEADIVFTHATPTDLELLVIDLGDSCVVKVVKGSAPDLLALPLYGGSNVFFFPKPFSELRKAIEGDEPVPRIEKVSDGVRPLYAVHYAIPFVEQSEDIMLTEESIDALSQLAGKPLPIYTGGTWEQLIKSGQPPYGPQSGAVPISVWRYTR